VTMRLAGALLLTAVAGFLLGACGSGGSGSSALSTRTGASTTRTQTGTLPTRTRTAPERETTAVETSTAVETTTTAEVVTTTPEPEPPPVTTRPPLTVTLAPLPTTTAETTTAVVVAPPPTTTATTETGSSSTSTPWGWIALVLALAGVGALIAGLWSRRRTHSSSWQSKRRDLSGRVLAELDEVLERGSVVTGHVQALADEARALEAKAPGGPEKAEAVRVRASLDELVRTLETDRTLRLGSPPPTAEQLNYSNALIRQQVDHLQRVLGPRA
jgi:hypothetical protein